ncbi:FtsB family cell division protein [Flaviflexus huanghaiensis]|uniref:FtsB family cell division protein n=1 Tax=Flaviflexus huanghaiensis TaxID=1111473 RepID=UPI0015FBFC54|nr:septum formation initiator family protein [Flaviflexus huanghaiensis]
MNSRRPGSSRGPTRPGAIRRTNRGSGRQEQVEEEPRLKKERTRRALVFGAERPRALSLRLLAIVLTAMLAVIIIAPTLSSYLDQQQQLRELNSSVEEARARVRTLQVEVILWNDDDYVRAKARERLGYVKPGEVLYVVNDPDEGTPKDNRRALEMELEYNRRASTPWFTTMWDSLSVTGYSDRESAEEPAEQPEEEGTK